MPVHVEYVDVRIRASQAIGVVQVEHGRQSTRRKLDFLEVDFELENVNAVAPLGQRSADADCAAIAGDKVAHIVGGGHGIVVVDTENVKFLNGFAQQWRVDRLPLDVDSHFGVRDIGESNGRTAHFIQLAQANLQLVGSRRHSRIQVVQDRTIAADSNVIGLDGPGRAGQNNPHPGVAWVRIPEIHAVVRRRLLHLEDHFVTAQQRQIAVAFRKRIDRASHDRAAGVEQFQDDVQGMRRAVDIEPDFGLSVGFETVHVPVARIVDKALNLKPEPPILVARVFVGGELAEEFGVGNIRVGAGRRHIARFHFSD